MIQTLNSSPNQAYRQTEVGEIPLDWDLVRLEELIADGPQNGIYKSKELYGEGTPIVRIDDFHNDGVFLSLNLQRVCLSNDEVSLYSLNENDILINRVNSLSHLGKCTLIPNLSEATVFESNMMRFHVDETRVLPEYLFRYLISNATRKRLRNLAKRAVAQSSINQGDVKSLLIPVPPLPEQCAIAHTLRTIQKAKEARQRELELERERKAALMQYLFTHGTRNEPRKKTELGDIPETWQVVKLGKVCKFLQYGTSKKCDLDSSGLPVLRIPNVIGGKIDTGDLKFIKLSSNEAESLMLKLGDLLFVRTNGRREYTGRCAVFSGELQEALFASYLIRARLDTEHLLPEFAQFYTMTYQGKKYLSERASSASDGKFNINTQTIKSVLIPKPDIDEQGEIINALQVSDRKITALEQEAAFLDELFRAMLEELMTGQLSALPLVEENALN